MGTRIKAVVIQGKNKAHNILSYSSQRESESWRDYWLETFEEIIHSEYRITAIESASTLVLKSL